MRQQRVGSCSWRGRGLLWALAQALLPASGAAARVANWTRRSEPRLAAGAVVAIALLAVSLGRRRPSREAGAAVRRLREPARRRSDGTRFLSGGGYRYDYWRVAWLEFKDAPLRGQGAGNYDDLYFSERRTTEDIRQPHSLPLQTLAELGLVGACCSSPGCGRSAARASGASRAGRASVPRAA